MDWHLTRTDFTPLSTIGALSINGMRLCWTLEDAVRHGPKIVGRTAIPPGRYRIIIDFSNRFQRRMPHVLDVPGFSGIRIHKGNTDKDTEGCILVAMERGPDRIWNCQPAYDAVMEHLTRTLQTEEVWLLITESPDSGTLADGEG